ncbi:MAG: hypothetical protein ACRD9S_02320 [Pyrinomonadaceae bacterium]
MELLGDALSEARRIDDGTPERAYALVALLAQFSKIDRVRAWELLSETVKAANTVADFTGKNGHTSLKLEGKFSIQIGHWKWHRPLTCQSLSTPSPKMISIKQLMLARVSVARPRARL